MEYLVYVLNTPNDFLDAILFLFAVTLTNKIRQDTYYYYYYHVGGAH